MYVCFCEDMKATSRMTGHLLGFWLFCAVALLCWKMVKGDLLHNMNGEQNCEYINALRREREFKGSKNLQEN